MKVFALLCSAAAVQATTLNNLFRNKNKVGLDINQKVYIENAPVLGDGAGEGALNQCSTFAAQHVANPDAPKIKVCGTGIKLTAYLRGRCTDYFEHSVTVGSCDKGKASDSCQEVSPAGNANLGHYQSYKIEQC